MEMRKVLGDTLAEMMRRDDRIVVLDADLSKANGTYPLRKEFPDRMFNVGVAEANMTGIAAGLATYGLVPFMTTFAPFATRRVCDQVELSIAYANLPVKIIGSDPGIAAELNGGTHMSVNDIGIMRGMPGMVVYEPADNVQFRQALPQIARHNGPVYIRMFRKTTPNIFTDPGYAFDLFKADILRAGDDVALFCSGVEVSKALDATVILANEGIAAEVVNVHTIKPLDSETILATLRKTGCAVTCENHSIYNGLGSAVMELAAEHFPVPIQRIGFQDRFGEVGKLDYLFTALQLTAEDIVTKAKLALAAKAGGVAVSSTAL
ncbi:MAG: transketolase family protein [Planctomycetes bacterium]|nr:transketolase family protein [Planctomycetota bacterium]